QFDLSIHHSNIYTLLFRILMSAGVEQLTLDLVDLPSFTTFDHLQTMLPSRGVGAQQTGFAPIMAGFESLLARLQQGVELADRAGKSGLQLPDFLVDLAVDSGGLQIEFPRELVGAVGASPNGAFEAVQKFERFLQTKIATHNRS